MAAAPPRQGDIHWVDLGEPGAAEPALRHPHVVVQNDVFNGSRIQTVVVCALTTDLRRAGAPGNILLRPGEADLPKQCVVDVSQIFTVDKRQLGDRIGSLGAWRVRDILDGILLVLEPRRL